MNHTFKIHLNDNTQIELAFRPLKITDLYGVDFNDTPKLMQNFALVAHRLSGVDLAIIENARPDSFLRMIETVTKVIEAATKQNLVRVT